VPTSTTYTPDNAKTILRNSLWYGFELLSGFVGAFLVSIVVARIIGPQRLGYYSYMMMLTNITVGLGSFGLPNTTRKYMAEHLNRGQPGLALSIYHAMLRFQIGIAAAITAAALLLVFTIGNPAQCLVSVLLVLNIAPRLVGFIPSQANTAAEMMQRNTIPSVLSGFLNIVITLFSLWIGWDLPGVAAGLLVASLFDTSVKLWLVHRILGGTQATPIEPAVRKQLFVYSSQGVALVALYLLVWDRSDVLFLKNLNPDDRQVTYFSLPFNLVDRLLFVPNAFAAAVAATLMAQYGRGAEKLRTLTVEGARYSFLIALPLLAGFACVANRFVVLLWGEPYRPMIPVLIIVTLLAIPKALMSAPTTLLQTTENQGFLVIWGCITGALNVVLDIVLTPRYGAIGAGVANGTAQTLAVLGLWIRAWRLFNLDLRLKSLATLGFSGAGMAGAALAVNHFVPGYTGLVLSVLTGALVWFGLLRWTHALDQADAQRFQKIGHALPGRARPLWQAVVALIVPETT